MHPIRTLKDSTVHGTPLIKNQDVNTRYLGSTSHFGWISEWPPRKNYILYIKCYLRLLPSVLISFMT